MKRKIVPALVLVSATLLTFSGCASFLAGLFSEVPGASAPAAVMDPLDGYVFAYIEGSSGDYHVAKILQPASPATKNQAEVLDMGQSGGRKWAQGFTSHPADKSELAVGEVVLVQGSGFSDPDTETLRATTWTAYYITDISSLFKGEVMAGSIMVPIKHLRIPDTEIAVR